MELPASPLPLSQLLAAFPKHLVGAHWVSRPGWTVVSCCGPPGSPASAGSASQNPQRPEPRDAGGGGGTQLQHLAQAPAWFPGPSLGEGVGS